MRWLSSIRALGIAVAIVHVAPPAAMAGDDLMRMVPQGQAMPPRPTTDPALVDLAKAGIPQFGGTAEVLANVERQPALATRGAHEAQIYRAISPSVVLVLVYEGNELKGLGSGSVIADGQVLTSWHVVSGAQRIAVVFKPAEEGAVAKRADYVRAGVAKFDEVSDLALVLYPKGAKAVKPIELGTATEIAVGADVNAIGHPTGQTWTYTRGVISQFRKGYKWSEGDLVHVADVIQTQTPISPGNSGGPLLSDLGHLVGVNAFGSAAEHAENLNFAVSVLDVRKFLAEPAGRFAQKVERAPQKPDHVAQKPEQASCEPHVLYEGRNRANTASIQMADVFCTGKLNATLIVPDDSRYSIALLLATQGGGDPDMWIYDWNRDRKWDYSLIASHHDGKVDLIGHHPDGAPRPSRVERYTGQPTPWANTPDQ
jgi:S1-C subfamily serine protease